MYEWGNVMNRSFAQALAAALSYAVVSRQISEEGGAVGFLYREAPVFDGDSGWRFFSGGESDEYVADADHFETLPLNDVLASHPELAVLMGETEGAWEWDDDAQAFVAVADWQPQ